MAYFEFGENGCKSTEPPPTDLPTIKIVVVGEPRCGKTTFIKTFYDNHRLRDCYEEKYSRVYPCECELVRKMYNVNIFELDGCRTGFPLELTEKHKDANAFVLMYAIDDPSSFVMVKDKWYFSLHREYDGLWRNKEPAILVGNKRDLRDDPEVIQRLARDNLVPVTQEQGESLATVKDKIRAYYDCSSTQQLNVQQAFYQILAWGRDDFNNKMLGYSFDDPNPDDS